MHTYRFVYNKTLGAVQRKEISLNKMELRNKLVTEKTKTNYPEYTYYVQLAKFFDFASSDITQMISHCKNSVETDINYLTLCK